MIKKKENEKSVLENKLNQINIEIRNRETRPRKSESVKFKTSALALFGFAGFVFGLIYG